MHVKALLGCITVLAWAAPCLGNDGDIDPAFGNGGSNASSEFTYDMLLTPAGDLLVLRGLHLAKLDQSGKTTASVQVPATMTSIAVMPDGNVVVSGTNGATNNARTLILCRFQSDLAPVAWSDDIGSCFSVPLTNPANVCLVRASVGTGSQVLVGGNCPSAFVAAFTHAGLPDVRFAGGRIEGIWNTTGDSLTTLVADPGGNGVMAGGTAIVAHEYSDGSLHQDSDFAVAALDEQGRFRTSFALTGKRTVGFDNLTAGVGSNDALVQLLVEPRRLMLIGVSGGSSPGEGVKRMVALKLNGDRDLSFEPSMTLSAISNQFVLQDAAVDAQGAYFLVGRTADPSMPGYFFVYTGVTVRVTPNGVVDMGFGGGAGYARWSLPGGPAYVTYASVVAQGNQPLIAHSGSLDGRSAIARLVVGRIFADPFELP